MAGFADRIITFAPLTTKADSFSAHTFAELSFKQGRLSVADFKFPLTQRIQSIKPSYTASQDSPFTTFSEDDKGD